MKENNGITKGTYIIKTPKSQGKDSQICSICANCQNKEFCDNRTSIKKMRKCPQCKNCTNCEQCDKFYINTQYKVIITVGRDHNGERIRKTFSSNSEDEALFKALQFRKDYKNGLLEDILKTNKTICELAKEIEDKKQQTGEIKPSSYIRNLDIIENFKKEEWGNKPIHQVRRSELECYFEDLRLYSNSSIKKAYNVLKKTYSIAYSRKYIERNFFEGEDAIRLPKSLKENKEIRALTKEEENKFVNYITINHCLYRHIFLLALYTGLRIGEIVVLTLDDLDFRNRIIRINKSISTDMDRNYIIGTTKTGNGRRKIIMNDNAYEVLKDAIDCMHPNERDLVFCRENGDLINRDMVNAELRRICIRIGLKKFTMHTFRHTFATRCVEAGLNFKAIQGFLGHANIQTTLDTYADLQDDFKRDEMKKYEEYMKKGVRI